MTTISINIPKIDVSALTNAAFAAQMSQLSLPVVGEGGFANAQYFQAIESALRAASSATEVEKVLGQALGMGSSQLSGLVQSINALAPFLSLAHPSFHNLSDVISWIFKLIAVFVDPIVAVVEELSSAANALASQLEGLVGAAESAANSLGAPLNVNGITVTLPGGGTVNVGGVDSSGGGGSDSGNPGAPSVPPVQSTLAIAANNATMITLNSTAGITVGMLVTGPGVPTGTTVTAVNGNVVTLSNPITDPAGTALSFTAPPASIGPAVAAVTTLTAAATNSTTLMVANGTNIMAGWFLSGVGVPGGVTVASVVGNTVTLSAPVTLPSGATVIFSATAIPNPVPGLFNVSVAGFVDPSGAAFNMRGLNGSPEDCQAAVPNIFTQFPNLTFIRMNCLSSVHDASTLAPIIAQYTSRNIVVELEDHFGFGGASEDNVAWYASLASAFSNNAYVFLEMPNEPSQDGQDLANTQIGIIQAIRGAGFTNPIGVQLGAGGSSNFDNVQYIQAQFGTNANLYLTPHVYSNSDDASSAQNYAGTDVSRAQALGMYPVIDEFGNAEDGQTIDPHGDLVVSSVIALNQAGSCGAAYWAMDNGNHPDGADSAFLTPDGSQLTSSGVLLQSWL